MREVSYLVGSKVGLDGFSVGTLLGLRVDGLTVGIMDGLKVVGLYVGVIEGSEEGINVGISEGR